MSTAYIDRIDDLAYEDDFGVPVYLRRRVRLTGVTTNSDFSVLDEAIIDAEAQGFTPGSVPTSSTGTSYDNLKLKKRTARLVPGELDVVDIDFEYVGPTRGESDYSHDDSGDYSQGGEALWKGTASLGSEVASVDRFGNPLEVAHTYPVTDEDFAGKTDTQRAEINVDLPQGTIEGTFVWVGDFPLALRQQFLGRLNIQPWAGGQTGTWRVDQFDFEPFNVGASPKLWKVRVELRYKEVGWQPDYWYRDPRTGRPPANLVSNVGYKTAQAYGYADFSFFPVLL